MSKLFIPTDRVGFDNYQKSIGKTYAVIRALLAEGVQVAWHTRPQRLVSAVWPEGHIHDSGFAVEDTAQNRARLEREELRYEIVEDTAPGALYPKKVRLAFYFGNGAGRDFALPLEEVLVWGGYAVERVSDRDIREGKLDAFDVLIVPGSPDAGECYYHGLSDLGFEKIKDFLRAGGQYLGVCGGAYLPLTADGEEKHRWLNAVEATDREALDFWRTGSAHVRVRVEDAAHPVFSGIAAGEVNSINMVYWEGPAMDITGGNIKSLGRFEKMTASGAARMPFWDMYDNDMAKEACAGYYNPVTEEAFTEFLKGKTAIAEGVFGNGHLMLFSPHPEMGNVGYAPRRDSLPFLLLYNGIMYLSACSEKEKGKA